MAVVGRGPRTAGAILVLLAVLGGANCTGEGNVETWVPPATLAGAERSDVRAGEGAASMISGLHGRQVAGVENSVVAYRGDEGEALLYVSDFPDTASSAAAFRAMHAAIRRGGTPFGHVMELQRGDRTVVLTIGMGRAHYYFQDRGRVIWLSVDTTLAERALEGILAALPPTEE